jgi:hypothetical protein
MSKKSEKAITPQELLKLNAAIETQRKAQNIKNRADIGFATAQQDHNEILQDISARHLLKEGDGIDPQTGVITRK